ncbi:MAG: hypothetical protein CMP10_02865 [Zetaproteobacteria bacterium]|mgnify:CR=1 FL=1|nr:hypothetical protein [Pseudobdellovibrionaceae bacterium]
MRYLLAIAASMFVTLGIFFFMSSLIKHSGKKTSQIDNGPLVEFIRNSKQQETKTRSRKLPKKPPPPEEAPAVPKMSVASNDKPQAEQLNMPAPSLDAGLKGGIGPYLGKGGGGSNSRAAMPIVRIEPQYPRKAAMRGIEGFVTVNFLVTESGSISEIKIVNAKPPRIFNRAAKKAVSRWKYKPKLMDGKPVAYKQSTTLDFKLEN